MGLFWFYLNWSSMRLNKRLVHWDTPVFRGGDWSDLITVNPRSIILFKSTCLLVHLEEWPHIVSEFNLLLCNMDTCLCGQLTLFFLVQSLSFDRKFGFAKYIVHIHMKMFVLLCFTSLEANNFFYASVRMFTAQIRPKPQSLSDINKCRILIFMIIDNKYQYTL